MLAESTKDVLDLSWTSGQAASSVAESAALTREPGPFVKLLLSLDVAVRT